MSEREQVSARSNFRPMDMSDSARRRLLQLGTRGDPTNKNSQLNVLVKNVIKIQSLFRAHIVRRKLQEIKNSLEYGTEHGVFDDTITNESIFFNAKVSEVYEREGKFIVPPEALNQGPQVVEKGPFRLHSGSIYIGEWDGETVTKRAGVGLQVWLDGSMYEG